MQESLSNNFLCHIIRDLFPIRNNVILYGDMKDLQIEMLDNQHSIGSFMLHTNRSYAEDQDYGYFWEIGINGPFIGYNSCDLFISIDYNPQLLTNNYEFIAEQISGLLKNKGIVFLVDPGIWSSKINEYLPLNSDLIREAKRYSMLKDRQVYIYENI